MLLKNLTLFLLKSNFVYTYMCVGTFVCVQMFGYQLIIKLLYPLLFKKISALANSL